MSSITSVVNHVFRWLTDAPLNRNPNTGAIAAEGLCWHIGWVLRDLTRLAEIDALLAYVGMAHFCLLLPLLTQEHPGYWAGSGICEAGTLHTEVVKAYRERVRAYRAQGKSFEQAQRLALAGSQA